MGNDLNILQWRVIMEIQKHIKIKALDGTIFYVNENHYNDEPDKSMFEKGRMKAWIAPGIVIDKDGNITKGRYSLEQLIDKALL